MFDLGPTKLLVIFVIVVVLLGPDKLPQVARQLGSAWSRLNKLRERVESELRESVPDLPSTQEIAHYARSPLSLLDRLSSTATDDLVPDPAAGAPASQDALWPEDPGAETAAASDRESPEGTVTTNGLTGNGLTGSAAPGVAPAAGATNGAGGNAGPADQDHRNGNAPGGWAPVPTGRDGTLEVPDDPSMN